MVELSILVWLLAFFFGYVGYLRGWTKEVISLSGIVLSLFALYQFDTLIRVTLFGDLPRSQIFYIQAIIFITIVFFSYQTRALVESRTENRSGQGRREERDEAQSKALGSLVGFLNGYMIGGTIWYFLDINNYPLAPLVITPPVGSASAAAVQNLPLYVLTANGTSGDFLSLLVVILFVIVLVLI